MAFQSVPDTAEIAVHGVQDGQEIVNTFYAKKAGGYVQADIDALATAVDGWALASWRPRLGDNYTYAFTTVRGLVNPIDLTATVDTNAGDGGIAGGVPLPNNVTWSVKRRSAFTGRGARGRVFVPGWKDGMLVTENAVSPVIGAAIESALNEMTAAIAAVDWVEVIVHRVAGGLPLPTALVYTVIEYVAVNYVIDSMRRRLPGRGA